MRSETSVPDFGFYNVTGKAEEVFRTQLALMSDPVQLDRFLSPDEVRLLIQEESRKAHWARSLRPPENPITYITCDSWSAMEIELLGERIKREIGDYWVWGSNYFKTLVPYAPHIDTGVGVRSASYKNVLLPLEIDGPGVTHLVFFKQRYFGDNTQFYRSGRAYDSKATNSGELFDYSQILYLNGDEPFDRAIYDEYLTHLDIENLRGFTVDRILPWTIGSCYLFDSAQIHCASNFLPQGIRSKMGLSLFTCRD